MKKILFVLTLLSVAAVATAAGSYSLFVLNSDKYNIYLSQSDDGGCTDADWSITMNKVTYKGDPDGIMNATGRTRVGTCLGTADAGDPQAFFELINDNWTKANANLNLASDIDLQEFSETTPDGTCDANHVPLKYTTAKVSFYGHGYMISNLCYVHDLADGEMTQPVGFFSAIKSTLVSKVYMKNVRIVVKDTRADREKVMKGDDYLPVGAVAGEIYMAMADTVTLEGVSIQAPLAGAVTGFLHNSTVKNVTATDDILLTNELEIPSDKGFAGSALHDWGSRYTVFLGGVAGLGFEAVFTNVTVRPKIQDFSSVNTPSALGGVAGLSTIAGYDGMISDNKARILETITLDYNDLGTSFTKISGGSAMGGLFGEIGITYGLGSRFDAKVDDFIVKGITGKVQIGGGKSDSVFAGGFIGRGNVFNGAGISFHDNIVNAVIEDSLDAEASHAYFAGGFIGFGGEPSSKNLDDSSFVSFVNSKATGSIKLAGNATVSGDDFGVRAYVGGFAGLAVVAVNGNGLTGSTSEMEITSTLKSSYDGATIYGSFPDYDSVFVGGFFGSVDIMGNGTNNNLDLKNSNFTGSIAVADSASPVFVGGVIGAFFNRAVSGGAKSVSFHDVSAKAKDSDLIKITASGTSFKKPYASMVGGICGYCYALDELSSAAVTGAISATGALGTDSLLMGGVVGATVTNADVTLLNSSYIGDIEGIGSATEKVGYLFGKLDATAAAQVGHSFHFGNDETPAPYGLFKYSGNEVTANWNVSSGKYSVKYVVRNGTKTAVDDDFNGVETADDMQNSSFAGILNQKLEKPVWAFQAGMNSDLPFIAYGAYKPVTPAPNTYYVKFLDFDDTEIVKKTVNEGAAAVPPSDPVRTGYTFTGWDTPFSKVVENITTKATYKKNKYWIEFKNGDESLQKTEVEFEDMPEYKGKTPTKAATATHTFEFDGWEPEIVVATKAATYTAKFKPHEIPPSSSSMMSSSSEFSSSSEMSSSSEFSSSSEMSSSSEFSSSSEMSSSSEFSSSSEMSSSSYHLPLQIVKSEIAKSEESAVLSFNTGALDVSIKTGVRLRVIGEAGVIADTLVVDSLRNQVVNGKWKISPIPLGECTVEIVVFNENDTAIARPKLNKNANNEFVPHTWQLMSVAAFDMEKMDGGTFFWWDERNPIGDYWQYRAYTSGDVDPTRGFWYGARDVEPVMLKSAVPAESPEIVWELDSAYSGWNLVANPHGWTVDLTKGKGGEPEFWRWNAVTSEYENAETLAPYEAVWAKVSKPVTFRVPAKPVFSITNASDGSSLTKKSFAKSPAAGWNLRVVLADDFGKRDSWNTIGAGVAETRSEPPAAMGDLVKLSIVEGKQLLAKSVKPESDEYNWNLDVSATTARDGFLSFEGVSDVAAEGLDVFVTIDGVTSRVTSESPLPLALGKDAKRVQVRVAKGAALVAKPAVEGFRVSQGNGSVSVGFTASENLAGANARVELVSIDGKVIASERLVARNGENSVNFAVPKRGLYFARMQVGSQQAGAKLLVK